MNKQEAQHVKEAQQNIDIQEKEETQEKQGIQDNTITHETQEAQKPISQNAGATIETPLGPATIAADTLTDENKNTGKDALQDANAIAKEMDAVIYDSLVKYAKSESMEKITAIFPDARRWTLKEGKSGAVFVLAVLTAVTYYIDTLPDYLETIGGKDKKTLAHFATKVNPETGNTLLMDFLYFKEDATLDKDLLKPEALIEIMAQRPKDLPAAVDKLNRSFWSIGKMPGKGMFDGTINTKPGNPKKPTVYYMFDARKALARFPDLAAEITEYDESVLSGITAILSLGQHYMTADEIYYSMGYRGIPGKTDRKKIDDAFNKFTARFVVNNEAEREAGLKYKKFEYDGDFLPFERVKGIRINGKDVDTAYHVYDYPAILRFARDRDQLPLIPLEVKQITLNRTPFINKIEKYLINRVLNAKEGQLSDRILWTSLYEECGADNKEAWLRARKYAKKLLDHYTEINWIKGYKTDNKGITLNVTVKKKPAKGGKQGKQPTK